MMMMESRDGVMQVVELLLDSPSVESLIDGSPLLDNLDNERTTCLHLAARNGHVDIIKYLIPITHSLLQPPVHMYRVSISSSRLISACLV